MLVKNAQKLCAALALGTTMAIASQPSALAYFDSYGECRDVFGPAPFCLQYLDYDESPDNPANSPTGDEPGQPISGVGSGDGADMVSVPEPSLILGLIAVGGFMLGSRKKAKA